MTDDETVARFAWERALRSDPDVVGTRLLVLLTLATYMDADGSNGRPGHRALADAAGVSSRTVRHHLAAAVDDGWLVLVRRGHRRGDGATSASCYQASQPAQHRRLTSTGTEPPLEDLDRQDSAPQPAAPRASTGTQPPPTRSGPDQDQEGGATPSEPDAADQPPDLDEAAPSDTPDHPTPNPQADPTWPPFLEDTPTNRAEWPTELANLEARHPGRVTSALADLPAVPLKYVSYVRNAVDAALTAPPPPAAPLGCPTCAGTDAPAGFVDDGHPCPDCNGHMIERLAHDRAQLRHRLNDPDPTEVPDPLDQIRRLREVKKTA